MQSLKAMFALRANPMNLLAETHGASVDELVAAGAERPEAARMVSLAETYLGRTPYTRMQADCARGIEANGHSLGVVELIEHLASRVADQRHKWRLRLTLCQFSGTLDELERLGRSLLDELKKQPERTEGISITRHDDKTWSARLTGDAALIAEICGAFTDKEAPVRAMHEALTTGAGVTTTLRPVVVVELDKLYQVLDGTRDETVFRCTDGVVRSSTQVLKLLLDEDDWDFALIHPLEGPVDLVRTKRTANLKQRILAAAENPTCAWDGCKKPADECQVHHLVAWQNGGHTTSSNLATCCAYHNGVNDDNPNAPPRRGALARIGGKVRRVWRP